MSPRRWTVFAAVVVALTFVVAVQVLAADPAHGLRRDDGRHKLWILFTDKGLTRDGERAAIEEFRAALPARALSRRAKVGFEVNRNDLPVATRYVDGVAATVLRLLGG